MNEENTAQTEPSRTDVHKMFDRIAHRYDFLNRALSLGQDVSWRKKVRSFLPKDRPLDLVDLATGTGDQIFFLLHGDAEIATARGFDLSEEMLAHGRKKIEARGLQQRVELLTGDAMNVPVEDDVADVLTISFGIRNVLDVPEALLEMRRVLRPGGKLLILEASLPKNALIRKLYLFYFRHVLPRLGGLVSGDSYAYRYLNQTVETFPCGEAFCDLMRNAGYQQVEAKPLTMGIATIYQGLAPEEVAPA